MNRLSWLLPADSFTVCRTADALSRHIRAIESVVAPHRFYSMDSGRWFVVRSGRTPLGAARACRRHAYRSRSRVTRCSQELLNAMAVFRKFLDRESINIQGRDLLRVYRRLEARGETRGGRFVGGFSGEQFASPDAVHLLRSIRRTEADGSMVAISAADPLNMLGILLPGPRLPQAASNRLLSRDGAPIAVLEAKEIRFLIEMDAADQWQARNALLRRRMPPKVRAYRSVRIMRPHDGVTTSH